MSRTYLVDNWYAAAWSDEVGGRPLSRRICDERVMLVRYRDGGIRAFADMCPHRKYPLTLGKFVQEEIQCGYHGLRFNRSGQCVLIPGQDHVPAQGLNLREFPALERYGMIHVWIGDAEKADPRLLPTFPAMEDPAWIPVRGYCHIEANYLLVLDNLNDLSHLAFVHPTTLTAMSMHETPQEVTTSESSVQGVRTMPATGQSRFMQATRRFAHDGPVDRNQISEFVLPSSIKMSFGASEPGEPIEPHHVVYNLVIPETERSTHYWWFNCRWLDIANEDLSRFFFELSDSAIQEDKIAIEAQQRAIDDDTSDTPLRAVAADRAAIMTRILIGRRIAEQSRGSSGIDG